MTEPKRASKTYSTMLKKKIRDLEDRTFEISKRNEKKKKRVKKIYETYGKREQTIFALWEFQKEKRKGK